MVARPFLTIWFLLLLSLPVSAQYSGPYPTGVDDLIDRLDDDGDTAELGLRIPDNVEGKVSPTSARYSLIDLLRVLQKLDRIQTAIHAADGSVSYSELADESVPGERATNLEAVLEGLLSDGNVVVAPNGPYSWLSANQDVAVAGDDTYLVFRDHLPRLVGGGIPRIHGVLSGGSRTKKPAVGPTWVTPAMFGIMSHPTRDAAHAASDDQTSAINDMLAWCCYNSANCFFPAGWYRVEGTVFVNRDDTYGRYHWTDGHYDEGADTAGFRGHLLMEGILCAPYSASSLQPIFKTDCSFQQESLVRVERLRSNGNSGTLGWSNLDFPNTWGESDTNGSGDPWWVVVEQHVSNHLSGDNTLLDAGILIDGQDHGRLRTYARGVCYGVMLLADGTRGKRIGWNEFRMVGDCSLNKFGYILHGRTADDNDRFQTITLDDATAGTWTITHDGDTTSAIQWDATTSEIDTALTALASITSCGVYEQKVSGQQWDRVFKIEIQSASPSTLSVDDGSLTGSGSVSYSNDEGWGNANRIYCGRGEASSGAPTTNTAYAGVAFTADPTLDGSQSGTQYFHHSNVVVGGDMCTDDTGTRQPVMWLINSGRYNEWLEAYLEQGEVGLWPSMPSGYANMAGLNVEHNVIRGQQVGIGEISGNEIRWNGFNNWFDLTTSRERLHAVEHNAEQMCSGLVPSGASRWVWRGEPKFGMFYWTFNDGAEWQHDGSIVQSVEIPVEVDHAGDDDMTSLDTLGGTAGSNGTTHCLIDGDRVQVLGSVGGASNTIPHYVYNADPAAGTFQLVTSRGSTSPVDFSSGGTNPTVRMGNGVVGPGRRYFQINRALGAGPSIAWPGVEIEIDKPNQFTRIEITRIAAASELSGGQEFKLGQMAIAGFKKDGSDLDPGSFSGARWSGTPAVPNFGTATSTADSVVYQREGSNRTTGTTNTLIPHYDAATPSNSAHRLRIIFLPGTSGVEGLTMAGFRIRITGNTTARVVVPGAHQGGTIQHRPESGLHPTGATYVDSGTAGTTVSLVEDLPSYACTEQYSDGNYYYAGQQVYTGSSGSATVWLCTEPGASSGATPDVDSGTLTADENVNRWIEVDPDDSGSQTIATWGP